MALLRLGMLVVWMVSVTWGVSASSAEELQKEMETQVRVHETMNYLLYLPEGYGKDGESWPLLIFLHGLGESGDDLEMVKKHGPPKLIEQGKEFPFIVVSPQCRKGQWWNDLLIDRLIDTLVKELSVDTERIYMTGLSMGGFGTWNYASLHPDRLAAIAPICGGGDPILSWRLRDLPIWAFHGEKDKTVPVERTKQMVEAVRAKGNTQVKQTLYPEAGHDSWTITYENPELYDWFLRHRRH